MAIYSLSTKPMSRSSGRSAVAAAAYRSGTELADERTGLVADYTRRRGVVHAEIVTRDGVPTPEREALWNQAEAAEKRKDARVAREYVVALPHELDADQRLALARELAGELSERYGVAVDLAIHAPDREGDQRNYHAHLLTTTRTYSHDGLGDKSAIEWSDKKRREAGLERGADEVRLIRQRWEAMANDALERAQVAERIDCRSLADQGIDRVPQIHVGPMGTEQIRRGTPEQSDRAMLNLEIQAVNLELHQLQERAARRAAERQAEYEDIRATIAAVDAERAAEARERAELEALAAELPTPPQRQEPEPEAQAPRPRTKREAIQAAAARITERRAAEARERLAKGQPLDDRQRRYLAEQQRKERRQAAEQAPAVQRIDQQIADTRRELAAAQERSADIGERLLDVQLELKPAALERDRTAQAAQEAAQGVKAAQAEVDSLGGLFKRGKRREASQRLDAAQERHRSAQEAAQAAQAHHATLSREYGELRQQAAPAGREVEKLEVEYQRLQRQRTAQIEREQPQAPAQEQGDGMDAWGREAAQERSQAPQKDAWSRERGQGWPSRGNNGPELG